MTLASLDELRSALGSIVLVLGGIVGFLTMCDWMMTPAQKKRLKSGSETAWIWLSYQQQWPYDKFLQNESAFRWLARIIGTLVCLFALGWVLVVHLMTTMVKRDTNTLKAFLDVHSLTILVSIFALPVPLLILRLGGGRLLTVFRWITGRRADWTPVPRAAVALLVSGLLFEMARSAFWLAFQAPPKAYGLGRLAAEVVDTAAVLSAISLMIAFMLLSLLSLLLLLYVAVAQLVAICFLLAEFIALRLAEYEKGPMLALAAVLTATGSILKAFGK